MITGIEAQSSLACYWPRQAQYWLNGWREPGAIQTAEQIAKTNKFLDILTELREQAQAGKLDSQSAKRSAIDRLIALHDPNGIRGLARRDCHEAQEARDIVNAIIHDYPERRAVPLKAAIPQGLEPSQFD